jgi:hypothetical protein
VPTRPSTPEVLQAKKHAPIPSPSIVFTFGHAIESIKELGGASESLAMIYVIKKNPHYLLGNNFTFFVNHKTLIYLINKPTTIG